VRQAFGLTDLQVGFVVSAPTLGAVISALVSGPVSDKIGRKRTLIIIAALYTVSAVASALAPSFIALKSVTRGDPVAMKEVLKLFRLSGFAGQVAGQAQFEGSPYGPRIAEPGRSRIQRLGI
jgi:MFS family permease